MPVVCEGQLGNTTVGMNAINSAVMVDFPDGFKATSIDAGAAHACSVGLDFTVVCWGRNTAGELGRGTFSSYESPEYVILPEGQLVRDLAVGTSHNCLKTLKVELYCWGEGDNYRLGRISDLNVQSDINENFDDVTQLGWITGKDYQNYCKLHQNIKMMGPSTSNSGDNNRCRLAFLKICFRLDETKNAL